MEMSKKDRRMIQILHNQISKLKNAHLKVNPLKISYMEWQVLGLIKNKKR